MPDGEPRFLGHAPEPQSEGTGPDANRFWLVYATGSQMTLDRAAQLLRQSGFATQRVARGYTARIHGGPILQLTLTDYPAASSTIEKRVRLDARQRALLAACDACLEISFTDLDAALDEVNTLIESQMLLQGASGGLLFMHWNDALQLPE